MKSRLALPFALALALAVACSPRLLPGTNIEENQDTRAIYDAVMQYRDGMNRRDANAVLALVAPDYFDNAGTPDPEDDVDAAMLATRLPQDLSNVEAIKLDLTIRKIEVHADRAVVEVYYDGWYRVRTPERVVPRRDSDIEQLRLQKIKGQWLFTGGL